MGPKRSKVRSAKAAAVAAEGNTKRAAGRAERDQFGRNLKRAKGELIPTDAARAILHTFHVLTGKSGRDGAEALSERNAIIRTSNLLGYDDDTVRKTIKEFRGNNCEAVPVRDGAARGHRGKKCPHSGAASCSSLST